jgi:protein SSD1
VRWTLCRSFRLTHVSFAAVHKIAQNCNLKRDAAHLAQEQSAHLYLCALVSDLTVRYGAVVRMAIVVGVLDEAFDVIVPEFGIEKRVHVDQIPLEVRILYHPDHVAHHR